MKWELRNHPAQARHPITREPLVDDDGQPAPLHPKLRSIWLDGSMVGYCGDAADKPVSLIIPSALVTEAMRESLTAFLRGQFNAEPQAVNAPPDRLEIEEAPDE